MISYYVIMGLTHLRCDLDASDGEVGEERKCSYTPTCVNKANVELVVSIVRKYLLVDL